MVQNQEMLKVVFTFVLVFTNVFSFAEKVERAVGVQVVPITDVPATIKPITVAPVTAAPVTIKPTAAPITVAPVTAAPTTAGPIYANINDTMSPPSDALAAEPLTRPVAGVTFIRKGVTWSWTRRVFYPYAMDSGVDAVGCNGCNAYTGDTLCTAKLPILCVAQVGSARPPYDVPPSGGVMPKEFYHGWSEGQLKVTPALYMGTLLASRANMDNICATTFGVGFKVVEHGMGKYKIGMSPANNFYASWWASSPTTSTGGWGLYGYSDIPQTTAQRYWMVVASQPAQCWN